jgi:hypothetical protein
MPGGRRDAIPTDQGLDALSRGASSSARAHLRAPDPQVDASAAGCCWPICKGGRMPRRLICTIIASRWEAREGDLAGSGVWRGSAARDRLALPATTQPAEIVQLVSRQEEKLIGELERLARECPTPDTAALLKAWPPWPNPPDPFGTRCSSPRRSLSPDERARPGPGLLMLLAVSPAGPRHRGRRL